MLTKKKFIPYDFVDLFRQAHPVTPRAQYGLALNEIAIIRLARKAKAHEREINNARSRALNPAWK